MGLLILVALVIAASIVVLHVILGPRPTPPPPRRTALLMAHPGCFACALASSAGDDYLDRHLARDH